jgi:hypothetical protein
MIHVKAGRHLGLCESVDVGCGLNHTPERALDARAATDRRTQQGYHSFVVKNGEVSKQTTKG